MPAFPVPTATIPVAAAGITGDVTIAAAAAIPVISAAAIPAIIAITAIPVRPVDAIPAQAVAAPVAIIGTRGGAGADVPPATAAAPAAA